MQYNATVEGARMQAALDAIDADASPAYIEICTASYASVLVTITLADPSFTRAGSVLTMAGTPKSGVAANPGTAAIARIKDGASNIVISDLTVGIATDDDITLTGTTIAAGQTVTISSGTLTHD